LFSFTDGLLVNPAGLACSFEAITDSTWQLPYTRDFDSWVATPQGAVQADLEDTRLSHLITGTAHISFWVRTEAGVQGFYGIQGVCRTYPGFQRPTTGFTPIERVRRPRHTTLTAGRQTQMLVYKHWAAFTAESLDIF
jgi:hypothetical protein